MGTVSKITLEGHIDITSELPIPEGKIVNKPLYVSVDDFIAADVAPVVHAHWKYVKRVLSSEWGECSNCDRANEVTRYCPYCGAKMDESEDEE